MDRIPASERTRERLKGLMSGHGEESDLRSDLVRLAARLIRGRPGGRSHGRVGTIILRARCCARRGVS